MLVINVYQNMRVFTILGLLKILEICDMMGPLRFGGQFASDRIHGHVWLTCKTVS